MKSIGTIVLIGLVLSGCSSRDSQNEYEEVRETRNNWAEIDRLVGGKRDEYTAAFDDLTFTGEPDDLNNVVLEVNTGFLTFGFPRYYHFRETDEQLLLDVHIIEGEEGSYTSEDVYETLVVDDVQFQDETYTVYAEEYTFELHTFQDSIRRLRDDSGVMLVPSYFIPEELEEQWRAEATEEVEKQD